MTIADRDIVKLLILWRDGGFSASVIQSLINAWKKRASSL